MGNGIKIQEKFLNGQGVNKMVLPTGYSHVLIRYAHCAVDRSNIHPLFRINPESTGFIFRGEPADSHSVFSAILHTKMAPSASHY